MVFPALLPLLPLIRTPRLPVVGWTDSRQIEWTRPFRRKTKSGFCACAITFQTCSTRPVSIILHDTGSCHKPKEGHRNAVFIRHWYYMDWNEGTLSDFRRVRRLLAWSCLYVRPHGTTRLPLDGFSWNLIFENFFFRKPVYKIQLSFKYDKNNGHLWWPIHIYDNVWFTSS